MKVAMITGYIPSAGGGGIERHVYDLAKGLLSRGVEVDIVCEGRQYFPGNYDDIRDHLKLCTVPEGLPLSLHLLRKSLALARAFDARDYDLIHAHAQYGAVTLLKNRARGKTRPAAVTTLHGTTAGVYRSARSHGLASPLPSPSFVTTANLERASVLLSDACIAVSSSVGREAAALYHAPPERVKVIHNWVDKRQFTPAGKVEARKSLGLAPDKKYLLFTGRADVTKGYKILVEAMEQVGDRAILLVASKNAGKSGEAAMKNIDCLGYVEDRKLPLYYSACDLFAFPSIYEGLPLTLIEAVSCGLVPVCMRRPPMDEVVDEATGYFCEEFKASAYAKVLIDALADPGLGGKSAECIRASARFDMDRSIGETLGLYESLLRR